MCSRRASCLLTVLVLTACTEPDPQPGALPGAYTFVRCEPRYDAPAPPPCRLVAGTTGSEYVDSGQVILRADHSARWQLGVHSIVCPCARPESNCTDPCTSTPGTVQIDSGSFTFERDSVRLLLSSRTVVLSFARGGSGGPSYLRYYVYSAYGGGTGVFQKP